MKYKSMKVVLILGLRLQTFIFLLRSPKFRKEIFNFQLGTPKITTLSCSGNMWDSIVEGLELLFIALINYSALRTSLRYLFDYVLTQFFICAVGQSPANTYPHLKGPPCTFVQITCHNNKYYTFNSYKHASFTCECLYGIYIYY